MTAQSLSCKSRGIDTFNYDLKNVPAGFYVCLYIKCIEQFRERDAHENLLYFETSGMGHIALVIVLRKQATELLAFATKNLFSRNVNVAFVREHFLNNICEIIATILLYILSRFPLGARRDFSLWICQHPFSKGK